MSENFRDEVEKIQRINVRNGLGINVPLKALATIRISEGPAEIRRISQQKSVVVTGNLYEVDLDSVSRQIKSIVDGIERAPDVQIYLAGQSKEQDVAFSSMIFAILLAIFLVYLVMASQFESFSKPLIIMFTIPFSIIGVIITGLTVDISISVIVLIGLVILSGIIVNNAIVLVDYIGRLQERGLKKIDAIKKATETRWRPIFNDNPDNSFRTFAYGYR